MVSASPRSASGRDRERGCVDGHPRAPLDDRRRRLRLAGRGLVEVVGGERAARHGAADGEQGARDLGAAERHHAAGAHLADQAGARLGAAGLGAGDAGAGELAERGLAEVAPEQHEHRDGARHGHVGAARDAAVVDEAARARGAAAGLRGAAVEDPATGAEAGDERHGRREEHPRVGAGGAEEARDDGVDGAAARLDHGLRRGHGGGSSLAAAAAPRITALRPRRRGWRCPGAPR